MKTKYKNSGFAGEMLVAAELSRLGYEVLLGNVGTTKTIGVDLAAVNPDSGKTTSISVKSLKKKNSFPIDPDKVRKDSVYVFVITNHANELPDFFVVRGATLLSIEQEVWGKWGRSYSPIHGRGIYSNKLEQWRNNWTTIDEN
ncbi:MAG: hypothetical protein KKA19_06800 [Candidatus Margulisbacteria bacterium]|nr:hypothetical protein [Candidatus Margulisiibacteriota bacterium]